MIIEDKFPQNSNKYLCISRFKIELIDKILLLFVFIYFIFYSSSERLFINKIINPILSKITSGISKDLIFIGFIIFILIIYIRKFAKKFQEKNCITINSIFWVLIFSIIYGFYIRNNKHWELVGFSIYEKIKYGDIIFICINFISLRFLNIIQIEQENRSDLHEDSDNTFKDLIIRNRSNLREKIIGELKSLYTKKSFAIGIIGSWGSGKSYFINKLKSEIKDSFKNDVIICFDPWKYDNPQNIIQNFFNELISVVKEYNSQLSNNIKEYCKAILALKEDNFTKAISKILDIYEKPTTINGLYKDIESNFQACNKRIFVFIDDLDRLNSRELLEVLTLIRNTASFPNVIYIAAYDKEYVVDVIGKSNAIKNEQYLEKIFQFEINLPSFGNDLIITKLKDLLAKNKEKDEINNINKSIDQLQSVLSDERDITTNQQIRYNLINENFQTLREIIRFVNVFNIEYVLLKNDVDLSEYLILTILKNKYISVYNQLSKDEILDESNDKLRTYKINKRQFILRNKSLQNDDKRKVLRILTYLFERKSNVSFNSIKYLRNRLIYFSFNLLNNISISEINSALKLDLKEFNDKIINWKRDKKINFSELIEIFKELDFENKEDFENKLRKYFNLYENISNDTIKAYWLDYIFSIVQNYDKYSLNLYNSLDEFKDFIKILFHEAKQPFIIQSEIAQRLLRLILYGDKRYEDLFTKEELQKIIFGYFKKFVDKNYILSEQMFKLFYNNFSHIDLQTNRIYFLPEAIELLKKVILNNEDNKKFYVRFLMREVTFSDDKKHYVLEPFIFDVFGSKEEFEDFLFNLEEDIDVLEIQAFYRKYKDNSFNQTVFERKTIEIISDEKNEFINSPTYPNIPFSKSVVFLKPHPWALFLKKINPIFNGCQWIAHCQPEELDENQATNGGLYIFKRKFIIPDNYTVKNANISLCVDDTCVIKLNNNKLDLKITNYFDTGHFQKEFYIKNIVPNNYFNKQENILEIEIKNIDFLKKASERNKNYTGLENPYGICYCLSITLE